VGFRAAQNYLGGKLECLEHKFMIRKTGSRMKIQLLYQKY